MAPVDVRPSKAIEPGASSDVYGTIVASCPSDLGSQNKQGKAKSRNAIVTNKRTTVYTVHVMRIGGLLIDQDVLVSGSPKAGKAGEPVGCRSPA